jgi:hypothetical protein
MRPPEKPIFIVLALYNPKEGMTLRQAVVRSGKSETTVRNWCVNRGIGRRVAGSTRVVSEPALEMPLDDDHAALKAYHSGDPSAASPVRLYYERTKVPYAG